MSLARHRKALKRLVVIGVCSLLIATGLGVTGVYLRTNLFRRFFLVRSINSLGWCGGYSGDQLIVFGRGGRIGADDLIKLAAIGADDIDCLDLSESEIPAVGLSVFCQFRRLRMLSLAHVSVKDGDFNRLRVGDGLGKLNLADTTFTGESLDSLAALPNLRTLVLANTHINDTDLAKIGSWENLQTLNVAETMITVEGLQSLSRMKNLRGLTLGGCHWVGCREDCVLRILPQLRWAEIRCPTPATLDNQREGERNSTP